MNCGPSPVLWGLISRWASTRTCAPLAPSIVAVMNSWEIEIDAESTLPPSHAGAAPSTPTHADEIVDHGFGDAALGHSHTSVPATSGPVGARSFAHMCSIVAVHVVSSSLIAIVETSEGGIGLSRVAPGPVMNAAT